LGGDLAKRYGKKNLLRQKKGRGQRQWGGKVMEAFYRPKSIKKTGGWTLKKK